MKYKRAGVCKSQKSIDEENQFTRTHARTHAAAVFPFSWISYSDILGRKQSRGFEEASGMLKVAR